MATLPLTSHNVGGFPYTINTPKKEKLMREILIKSAFRIVKAKAMPMIRAFACKYCATLAYVSVQGNTISVAKCACVKAGA